MLISNKSSYLGLLLLFAFFIQYFLKLEFTALYDLQQEEMYKRWSGLGLAIFIAFQWLLSLTRITKKLRTYAMGMQNIHKWIGAISPVIFYIHSMGTGYGYLLLLSYIFFSNALLGYLNLDLIKNNSELLFKWWMVLHVAFSLVITILMVFHIAMVFYYK